MPTETRYCKPGAKVETLDKKTGQKRLLMTIDEDGPLWIPGEDIQYIVTPDGEPPKPPPAIEVGDSPFPKVAPNDPTLVKSIEAALTSAGGCALQRGATYQVPATIDVFRDDVTIEHFGNLALPSPKLVATTNARLISVVGRKGFTLNGVELTTSVKAHTEAGLWLASAAGVRILRSNLNRFRQGFVSQGSGSLLVEDSWIHDNSRQGNQHGAGYYAADKVALTLRRSLFDTNGWRLGEIPRDGMSHNGYTQGNAAPMLVEDCLFAFASSHGIQMRSGGTIRRCGFLSNPIAMSYGRVNGGPCFPGGVTGTIEDVWVVECPEISPTHRPGWAIELGNIRDVKVNGVYVDGDVCQTSAAIIVGACSKLDNPRDDVQIRSLAMANCYAPQWRRGVREVQLGQVSALAGVPALAPTRYADLRAAIGTPAGFIDKARKSPSTAAPAFIGTCKAAWGVNGA